MPETFELYQSCMYIIIIIIIGMNVVDNLNSVLVINKPCMSSRNMRLLLWAALRSDSEHQQLTGTNNFLKSYNRTLNKLLRPSPNGCNGAPITAIVPIAGDLLPLQITKPVPR
jgi:hypothetical protein